MGFTLSNEQWVVVAPLVARPHRLETRGRPPRPDRELLNVALLILAGRDSWRKAAREIRVPFQTVYRRYTEWKGAGVLDAVLAALAKDMEERGGIPLRGCFMDDLAEMVYRDPHMCILTEGWDSDDLPWEVRTRIFFSEVDTWRSLVRYAGSKWLRDRLPSDLLRRADVLEPYL